MGNEYTVTCRHGNTVYRGSSQSDYNYYRNTYTGCATCHSEDNAENERRARERAEQRRRGEGECSCETCVSRTVRQRAQELQRKERERQIAREKERKRQRLVEEERMREKRKQEAAQREERRKKMEAALKQKQEELQKEAERLSCLKLQNCDPFLQYKKLNTLQTVKEIGEKVSEVAVVGEIVKERVAEITTDLIDTLGGDYNLIKDEMDRYEKYGEEMTNMTNVFKTELQKAFHILTPGTAKDSTEMQNDANTYQKLIDEEDDEDAKEYYQKKKKSKEQELTKKLKAVDGAMKSIEGKLKVMESYYDQMMQDYEYFVRFTNTKEDELSEVIAYFQSVAADLKQAPDRSVLFVSKDSDLYDDYKSKPQILSFTEKYEYKETHTSDTGIDMCTAVAAGAFIGGVGGAAVGGICGGVPGAIGGAIVGCIGGAAIGAIVGFCNKPEYKVGYTTRTGTVTVTSDLITYKSKEHAKALEDIVIKVQDSEAFKNMRKELKENKALATEQKRKLRELKTNMMKVQQPLTNYKVEMKKLRKRLNKGKKIEEDDAKMIDKQLQKLSAEMQTIIESMDK